jgi:FMN reductase [NAD(P)H]
METTDKEALRLRFGSGASSATETVTAPLASAVLGRRTHRRYADRAVPDDLIQSLCHAALSTSSKSDFQQASLLEVRDPTKRAALAAPFPAMPWIGYAPRFLVFLADARRLEKISDLRGHPQSNAGLEGFFNAAVDAALALQTFILCAEDAGLGCCPISVLRNHAPLIGAVLELPDRVFPVAGLCVGWPADKGYVTMRLPPAITLHTDRYTAGDFASHLDRYDREREARNPTPPDKQRAVAVFGNTEFYGWSEDKARQAAQPEGAAFPPWLRAQGFTFD